MDYTIITAFQISDLGVDVLVPGAVVIADSCIFLLFFSVIYDAFKKL